MAKKPSKFISCFSEGSPECYVREAFLRVSRDTLDNYGIEIYSVEQIRGALDMLERYKEIKEEISISNFK